jgi:hypothetical protein
LPKLALRPLFFTIFALTGTLVLDRISAIAMEKIVASSDHRLSRIYAGTASADVLILGSSVANAMVIPPHLGRATGREVFTIASHGIDARTQEAFALDLLDHNQAPKIAVLEMRPVFSPTLQAPAFSSFQGLSSRLGDLEDEASQQRIPWRKIFRVYGFNSPMLMTIVLKVLDRDDQATGPSNGHINEAMKVRWRARHDNAPKIDPQQLQALVQTIDAFRRANTHVIIVAAPLHPSARPTPWMRQISTEMRAAIPSDVPVIDYSDLLNDDKYFEDPIHLNAAGREVFQPYLAEMLSKPRD